MKGQKYLLNGHNSYEQNYLVEIDEDTYQLDSSIGWTQVGYSDKTYVDIIYVDPSGGPMLSVDDIIPCNELEKKKIKKIKDNNGKFLIITENYD